MKKLLTLLLMLLTALFGGCYQAPPEPDRPHRFMGLPPPPDCDHHKELKHWAACMGVPFKEGTP